MYKQYPFLRAFGCAALTLVLAAAFERLRHLRVPGLSAWQSHIAAILVCAAVIFLLALVIFPRERSKPWQFHETDQTVHDTRGRVQDAMAESESRYRRLFENMLEGCAYWKMLFDDRGSPMDFVYLDVNGAFGKLTGLRNVVGKRFAEVIPGGKDSHPESLER